MHPARLLLIAVNVAGGIAVLGSYAHGIATHPDTSGQVWGGVPEELRQLYTVSMLLAAAGYFPFTYFVVCRLDPDRTRVAGRFGFVLFVWLYAIVLVPSALWMPLTFAMLDAPSGLLWLSIRLVLFAVAIGSLALLTALPAARPRDNGWPFRLAIAGCLAFCLQTAILDALVWPAYFPW
jgi:hypothetical protein